MRSRATFLLLIVLAVVITACNGSIPGSVTPADTSASVLDLRIFLRESSSGATVIMQFLSEGRVVNFQQGESVTCNDQSLEFSDWLGYGVNLPPPAAGGNYRLVYGRNGVDTVVMVDLLPPPVFITPTAGAVLARSNNLTINYMPRNLTSIEPGATTVTSTGAQAIGGKPQPDTGTYSGFDVSSLEAAGPGTLSLSRNREEPIENTGFKSAQINYSRTTSIKVTWL